MNKEYKFMYTDSEESAQMLQKMGFKMIQKVNNQYFFLNESNKLVFNSMNDIAYTNKLFL